VRLKSTEQTAILKQEEAKEVRPILTSDVMMKVNRDNVLRSIHDPAQNGQMDYQKSMTL